MKFAQVLEKQYVLQMHVACISNIITEIKTIQILDTKNEASYWRHHRVIRMLLRVPQVIIFLKIYFKLPSNTAAIICKKKENVSSDVQNLFREPMIRICFVGSSYLFIRNCAADFVKKEKCRFEKNAIFLLFSRRVLTVYTSFGYRFN